MNPAGRLLASICVLLFLTTSTLSVQAAAPPPATLPDDVTTVLVKDIYAGPQGSRPGGGTPYVNFVPLGSHLYFQAQNAGEERELWRTDGTTTELVHAIQPGSTGSAPENFATLGNHLYFKAYTTTSGSELWRTDGTTTELVRDIKPGGLSSNPAYLTVFGNHVYFEAENLTVGKELWRTDGTTTELVHDVNPDGASGTARHLTVFGNHLYFVSYNTTVGSELWRTDGTTTELVADMYPDGSNFGPTDLTVFGNHIYFMAYNGSAGNAIGHELWRTDGTTIELVHDIYPGINSGSPSQFTVHKGHLYFTARNDTSGTELWRTDGTTLQLVKDLTPGGAGSNFNGFVSFGDHLYFSGSKSIEGDELWRTDGTDAGTVVFKEFRAGTSDGGSPGKPGSFFDRFTVYHGKLYFSATDGIYGHELWRTDGTTTEMVTDIRSGSGDASPFGMTVFGGAMYFQANNGTSGVELFKLTTPAPSSGNAGSSSTGSSSGSSGTNGGGGGGGGSTTYRAAHKDFKQISSGHDSVKDSTPAGTVRTFGIQDRDATDQALPLLKSVTYTSTGAGGRVAVSASILHDVIPPGTTSEDLVIAFELDVEGDAFSDGLFTFRVPTDQLTKGTEGLKLMHLRDDGTWEQLDVELIGTEGSMTLVRNVAPLNEFSPFALSYGNLANVDADSESANQGWTAIGPYLLVALVAIGIGLWVRKGGKQE